MLMSVRNYKCYPTVYNTLCYLHFVIKNLGSNVKQPNGVLIVLQGSLM